MPEIRAPEQTSSAVHASITAGVLRRGAMLHHISLLLTFLILAQVMLCRIFEKRMPHPWLLVVVVLSGTLEFWFAARVALDADLFETIAIEKSDLKQFDAAMVRLGMAKPEKVGRSVDERASGALRLFKRQGFFSRFKSLPSHAACSSPKSPQLTSVSRPHPCSTSTLSSRRRRAFCAAVEKSLDAERDSNVCGALCV